MRSPAMSKFLMITVVVALVVTFLYTLLNKWKVWEYLQVHADGWLEEVWPRMAQKEILNQLFSCAFCTTWWMSVIICFFAAIFSGYWLFLLVPFCSTPISRYLV